MACLGQPNQVRASGYPPLLTVLGREKVMFCFNICRRIIDPGRKKITHKPDNSSVVKPRWGFTKSCYDLVIYPRSHKICANSASTEILSKNPTAVAKVSCVPALPCFPDTKPSLLAHEAFDLQVPECDVATQNSASNSQQGLQESRAHTSKPFTACYVS